MNENYNLIDISHFKEPSREYILELVKDLNEFNYINIIAYIKINMYKTFNDMSTYRILELFKKTNINFHNLFLKFNKSHTQCYNCGNYFETTKFFCKSPDCIEASKKFFKNRQEKMDNTCLKRYGCKKNFSSQEHHTAFKNTMTKKYGADNASKSKELRLKREQIFLEKFGATNPFSSDLIKNKIKKTMLKLYGAENPSNVEKFQNKKMETNLKKYGVKWYNNREKMRKNNLERYGVEYSMQRPDVASKVRKTKLEKYGVEHSRQIDFINLENLNEEFVKNNFIKDNKFDDVSFRKYFNILSPVTSSKYKDLFNIQEPFLRRTKLSQNKLADMINTENKLIDFRKFKNISELDIFLPDYNLAIEYNGLMFHSFGKSKYTPFNNYLVENSKIHLSKTEECEKLGIQLFHIFEGESIDLWLSMIHNKLGLNNKIPARKCLVKELKYNQVENFLNENHLQGSSVSKINLGLFIKSEDFVKYSNLSEGLNSENNEVLVAVMSFSRPRFNKNYEYELIRFCSLQNYSIVGGASKLFKYFIKNYNPKSIISYANRRFSNGSLYYNLGFKLKSISSPNYFYFKGNSLKLESRNKYQKHKLKDILNFFDENLTETENMYNNNYRKIYDCGNLVFEYLN